MSTYCDEMMPDDEPGQLIPSSSYHSNHSSYSNSNNNPPPRPVSPDSSVSTAHASNTASSSSRRVSDRDRPWRTKAGRNPTSGASSVSSVGSLGSNSSGQPPPSHGGLGLVHSSHNDPTMGGVDILGDLSDMEVEQRLSESSARRDNLTGGPPRTVTPRGSGGVQQAQPVNPSAILGRISKRSSSNNPSGLTVDTRSSSGLDGLSTRQATPVESHNSDRWNQFDTPDLAHQTAQANATAIASAAESAASRHSPSDRHGEDVMVLDVPPPPPPPPPPPRPVREPSNNNSSRAGMLGKAAGSLRNLMSPLGGDGDEMTYLDSQQQHRQKQPTAATSSAAAATNSASNRHSISPHDAVRLQALQMLQLAGGADDDAVPREVRRTATGGYTTASAGQQREPSAISGLDMSLTNEVTAAKAAAKDSRFEIDEDDDADRVARGVASPPLSPGGYQDRQTDRFNHEQLNENEVSFEEEDNLAALTANGEGGSKSSWSSRYSVDRQLMFLNGGQNASADYARTRDGGRSATGMYRASAYDMKSSGSSSRAASNVRDGAHRNKLLPGGLKSTVWMDVDLSGRSSLPPPPHHSQVGNYLISDEIRRVRRRRVCIGTALFVSLAAIIGSLYGTMNNNRYDESAANYWNVGEKVTFMVTSDVPYNQGDEERLARELTSLPGDAEFVVHLGDLGLASMQSCAQSVYEGASSILKTSRSPVFVVPGNNDWNDCPNPEAAFGHWMDNFKDFEDNFNHDLEVTRQLGREENFAFLQNGVLFIGLNLVNGHVPDRMEWDLRHQENVQWTEQNLNRFSREEYRAIVILGHARPTTAMGDYFWPVINDLNDANKPVLYVHANDKNGWELYQPFSDAGLMQAVELDKGGNAPPVKVVVEFGGSPFRFDRRI